MLACLSWLIFEMLLLDTYHYCNLSRKFNASQKLTEFKIPVSLQFQKVVKQACAQIKPCLHMSCVCV